MLFFIFYAEFLRFFVFSSAKKIFERGIFLFIKKKLQKTRRVTK